MNKKGFILITVMSFLVLLLIGGSSYLYMITSETKSTANQIDDQKAFFLAESGIDKAAWRIKNNNIVSTETFQLKGLGTAVNYLENQNIIVTITDLGNGVYQVMSSAQVGSRTKTLNAILEKNPPATIFDYGYFVNNWGWFYGHDITANGDVRSNGRFDFREGPRVEGDIYSCFEIDDGGDGIRGSGGEVENQHPYSTKLPMANLHDLSYYENKAKTEGGTLVVDGVTLVNGVFGDDAGESGNIVLIGTHSNPIEIDGTVVIRGDVVIKGVINGQGTIYAGRNVYVANDITYKNTPNSPRPASDNPETVDGWVNANKDKDLVGFAARENVVLGDYTSQTGGSWYSNYWLFSMGKEDAGKDGIPDTNDTYENDNVFQTIYEDVDGDGVRDDNYNWSNIQTLVPISNFANCPQEISEFGDIATNSVNSIDGVFYTNHAFAGRVGGGAKINGAVISKDEAIIYTNTLVINYDERINSRYTTGQSNIVDVDLPISKKVEIIRWWE